MSKEKKSLIIKIAAAVIAVLVIGLAVYDGLYSNGTILRGRTALESENFKVNGTMMAYFYGNQYQNYYSLLSYYGVDTTASMKSQEYSEGMSWFDFFLNSAKSYASELLTLCEGAKAAGLQLDDADRKTIQESLDSIEETAKSYGYSADGYLSVSMQNPVKLKDVKKCFELSTLASKYYNQYMDSLTYSDEKLDEYFAENADSLNGVDYWSYTFSATSFATYDENENPASTSEENSARAEEAAKKLAGAATADAFKTTLSEILNDTLNTNQDSIDAAIENAFHRHAAKSAMAADVSDWAFGASEGETHIDGETGDTSFTVYLLTRAPYADETHTRSVRHILFRNTENDGEYADDAKAKEVYAEWEAAGFSEDKLIELVPVWTGDTGSATNGGLYEDVKPGQMVAEFNDWLFDENRKPGDHDIVETSFGWHIMYYVGEGEHAAWQVDAIDALRSEDYKAMIDAYSDKITVNDKVLSQING